MEENPVKTEFEEDEINLLDLFIVLAKRKKLIIYTVFGIMVLTAIISLIMAPIYKAETKILAPQQSNSSSAAQLLGQLGGAAEIIGSGLSKTTNDLYIALLKSNSVLDRMIDRFDLIKFYKVESREEARRILSGAVEASSDKKSGIITISVKDKDAKKAAQYTNAFVEELRIFNKGLAVTEASQRRLFFEEQLVDVTEALTKSEEDLKEFQEKTGVMQMESQAKAVIEGIAKLRAEMVAKEVNLRVLKTYSTSSNPDVKKAEEGLKALKAELQNLQRKNELEHEPFMPTGEAPQIGLDYARKLRDFKFYETLYELLIKQCEAAKLDEAKDATIIQVVDRAEPPEKRFKPKRTQMVLIAGFAGFFLSVFAAFIMEYMENASANPENKEKIDEIRKHLSLDFMKDVATKLKAIKINKNRI